MGITSIAGATKPQSSYEFPDYQEKIEQLQKQIENLQGRVGKVNEGENEAEVKQQRVEMIQSQISQIQTQIQRLESMESSRNVKEVAADAIEENLLAPERVASEVTTENKNEKSDRSVSETKLDILV